MNLPLPTPPTPWRRLASVPFVALALCVFATLAAGAETPAIAATIAPPTIAGTPPPETREGATALERLRAEVVLLRRLARAQKALAAGNAARARTDLPPQRLDARLCRHPRLGPWCRRLHHTFPPAPGVTGDRR